MAAAANVCNVSVQETIHGELFMYKLYTNLRHFDFRYFHLGLKNQFAHGVIRLKYDQGNLKNRIEFYSRNYFDGETAFAMYSQPCFA